MEGGDHGAGSNRAVGWICCQNGKDDFEGFLQNSKYDIEKHPRYKYLSDFDERNAFDIEKEMSVKAILRPTDTVRVIDLGTISDDEETTE